MNRIIVSAKACLVAEALQHHLYTRVAYDIVAFRISDSELAASTGLSDTSCYRALTELDNLGALRAGLVTSSPTSTDKTRRVELELEHWLWTALEQLNDTDPAPTHSLDAAGPCDKCSTFGWDTCQNVGA